MAKPRGSICLEVTSVEIHITHIKIITCNALHLKIYLTCISRTLQPAVYKYTTMHACMYKSYAYMSMNKAFFFSKFKLM